MSSKDEFLQYLGAAGGAIVLLFLAQAGLRSCLDIGYHEKLAERPANPALIELRAAESQALARADIAQAMAKVAKNRNAAPSIAPKASDDLSAMTGWIQSGHKPYEPENTATPTENPATPKASK